MARIRSVHPGLFTDEAFMAASAHARILLIGLWTEADDQGVFDWKPLTLKARLLPVDAVDVGALLAELEGADVVRRFEHSGRSYGAVRNFRRFQRPQKPTATHPLPESMVSYVGLSNSPTEPLSDGSSTPTGKSPQMEDVGDKMEEIKERGRGVASAAPDPSESKPNGSGKTPKGTRFPPDWHPTEDDVQVAYAEGLTEDEARREFEKFKDYFSAAPGQRGVKTDWHGTFRNWMRKAADDKRARERRLQGREGGAQARH